MKTEGRIQQEIVKWYRGRYCLSHHDPQCAIFSVPNEAAMTVAGSLAKLGVGKSIIRRVSSMITNLLKSTGMMSGVSDLIVLQPGRVLFIEVKTPSGRQSKTQLRFENIVSKLGFKYFIVRSLDEFKDLVNQ